MATTTAAPRFQLCYWPLPFRGAFVSYLFAYRDVPFQQLEGVEEIQDLIARPASEQPIPFLGPPVLRDLESGRALSQMPAIVLYVAHELELAPEDPFAVAMCMKVLMDCNDVLMEICRYNGSYMWQREDWQQFRRERLPRWLRIFEESLNRGAIGADPVSFADIGTYALFGNMLRCLPELATDVSTHAPEVLALCQQIGAQPSLAAYVAEEQQQYGELYCGGQIEASIREMLALDGN